MEKDVRSALLEAGIRLLAEAGARRASARGAEVAAGAPHGSMRHHFGSQEAFVLAMANTLFSRDVPLPDESQEAVLTRWMAGEAIEARGRLELMVLATREPKVAEVVRAWQSRYVAHFEARGSGASGAQAAMRLLTAASIEHLMAQAVLV